MIVLIHAAINSRWNTGSDGQKLRELRKALTKASESGLPPRGLPHHDQEGIAREGNYYGLENRPNKSGVFDHEKLYLFQHHRDHPGYTEHI